MKSQLRTKFVLMGWYVNPMTHIISSIMWYGESVKWLPRENQSSWRWGGKTCPIAILTTRKQHWLTHLWLNLDLDSEKPLADYLNDAMVKVQTVAVSHTFKGLYLELIILKLYIATVQDIFINKSICNFVVDIHFSMGMVLQTLNKATSKQFKLRV